MPLPFAPGLPMTPTVGWAKTFDKASAAAALSN
jgi:hypothetical protein